ncbi:Crp/Fnr family transcriptional regulator [Roseicella aquatilis]|nr:Crp/Fnr family transcriptional regulator [Roseicella aquatilis]
MGNRVLDSLDRMELVRMLPELQPLIVSVGDVLAETGERLDWVLFPVGAAVISLIAVDHDGRTAEAVSVGSEGMVGPEMTNLPGFGRLQVQMRGTCYRIGRGALSDLADASAQLRGRLDLHCRTLLVQALQAATCAALHPVEARASRWLLMAQDRLNHPDLPVTQEALATLLGVRRTTVTRVMAQLTGRGLIRHRRSRVIVTNREGLEGVACGCHAELMARLRQVAPAFYPPSRQLQ